MIADHFSLLRPKQWIKNFFIFAALFFSKKAFQFDLTIKYVFCFGLFCMLTSSIYIINDIVDKSKDQLHPQKRNRPIASGKVTVKNGMMLSLGLVSISLFFSYFINIKFLFICLIYLIMNILYSLYLKKIVIVDIFCIAIGFVLRVIAGSVIGNIIISHWIIICTLMLSLFLGFTKRRHELMLMDEKANYHRPILVEYSTLFLDQMISVVTTSTVIFYILYTLSQDTIEKFHTNKLMYTVIFVIYGIFRYLYLVYKKELGGSPTIALLTDGPLLINVLMWVLSVGIVIYL